MMTIWNFCRTLACVAGCCIIVGSAGAADESAGTTSSVYRIIDGRVVFPSYDDTVTSAAHESAGTLIAANDFPDAKVYRDQLLLVSDPVLSKPLDVGSDMTTLSITARSRPAADIFPRLRVSLITADNNRHRIFEGYWQSMSQTSYEWPISEYAKGGKARLEIELLNPGVSEEQRTLYYIEGAIR